METIEDSIDILTEMKIKAHFNKDNNKEKLISFCIKLLKEIIRYEQ